MRFMIAVGAALLTAGLTTGTAAAAETGCREFTSAAVQLADPGRWAYTYNVTWCVVNGKITTITPHLTHEADGSTCVWVTNAEEAITPAQDDAWNAYNMGEFSCKNGDGTDGSVNPWGVITVWPNGDSRVLRKGIG
ncbi:hypothetical protein ACWEIJ_21660 [Lentzea sp. NPDC004789]